jgi:hypothetical protein
LLAAQPSTAGLPGITSMPWASNSPASATTSAVRSCSPADEPAMIVTRSHSAAARSSAALSKFASSLRPRILYRHAAPLTDKRRQNGGIEIDHRTGLGFLAGLNQFVAGWNNPNSWPRISRARS